MRATIDKYDATYTIGDQIEPVTLPEATGGSGVFHITALGQPELQGLDFDTTTRTLSGAPSLVGVYEMVYTATDSGPDMGTATLRFSIYVVPAAVGNLQAMLVANYTQVKLTWDSAEMVTGYDIERCVGSCTEGSFEPDHSFGHGGTDMVPVAQAEYIDENVTVGSTYTYRIAAYLELTTPEGSTILVGPWSELVMVSVEMPATPTPTATVTPTPTPTPTPTNVPTPTLHT